jgi:hypothetical protein
MNVKIALTVATLIAPPLAAQQTPATTNGMSPRHAHIRAKVMSGSSEISPSAADRLATLLADVQNSKATLDAGAWRAAANEASALARKLGAGKDAREAQAHIAQMRTAAMKSDVAGARLHAGMAFPFVLKVAR